MRAAVLLLPYALLTLAVTAAQQPKPDAGLAWTDATSLTVEGRGWPAAAPPFARLPEKAEKLVRKEVWSLGRHSAGVAIRFRSDASAIDADWEVTGKNLALNHMPATGVSGLDLYVLHQGKWRWLGVGRPTGGRTAANLVKGLPGGATRDFLLYLPLYNGVKSLKLGVPKGATIEKAAARPAHKKPVVFYGTSITQGGCASRPGMVHTAILGRRFDWPVINLGFSGNGKMELEIAKLLGEIDAAAYVIDCLPNMSAREVAERTEPLVRELRKARPSTPIVLVEDRTYANADLLGGRGSAARRAALRAAYRKMESEGVVSLHYVEGASLLGDDGEATVDSSHPTDLGFLRQADAMAPTLRYVLPAPEAPRAVVEGYAGQVSYAPTDTASFHVSCAARTFDVEIARVGAERKVVWTKKGVAGKRHEVPKDASSHGCRWPASFTLKLPAEWASGYYAVRLVADSGPGKRATSELFFILRSASPGKTSKVLLQLATNTYNAYTSWGGYSLYAYNGRERVQGRRVSFDRPLASQFRVWELPFVQWAEKAGYAIDYASNCDLEHRPELLPHYKLVLSVGHDEYWSSPMRDSLEKFIAAGGHAAFFSGNTCCWQVRSEDRGRALVCFNKQAYKADPLYPKGERKLLSTLWSHHLLDRPENSLTGVGFLHGGYHRSHGQLMNGPGAFTVHRPEHWLLAGTNLRRGDAFGGKDTVVGYECDGCELAWKDGLPYPTHRDGTPKGFAVLATAPARWHPDDCEWYERWPKGREGHAVLGTYTRGGTVVTVGTTDWSHGLSGGDAAVVRITKNVLERLGK